MGEKVVHFINKVKSIGHVLLSNAVSFAISALVTFVVPRQLGIENYGYFQLYLFFANYTGFLHFGWADGIFLRYGGAYYNKLDYPKISGQVWLYCGLEILLGTIVCLAGYFFVTPQEKCFIIILIGVSIVFHLPKTLLQYILQCTNRIKEYAILVIIEKIVYMGIIVGLLIAGIHTFLPMIIADLLAKMCSLAYAGYQCRRIIVTRPEPFKYALKESGTNIVIGINLMFANIASMLIIGLVRFSIERQWDVATFGKISLTMSVSNMLMVFINAVALVMFPMLRRTNADRLAGIYSAMRICLMMPLLGMLIFYYPIKEILSLWLPQYAESLIYMAILFPMCVYESKMSMLISTYLKTLRKERYLLLVNSVTVILSAISTYIFAFVMHNLNLLILSIVILLAFRCVFAELLLSRVLEISVKKDIVLELALTAVFVFFSWAVGGILGLLAYLVAYGVYIFIQRKQLMALFKIAKEKLYHQKLCERKE